MLFSQPCAIVDLETTGGHIGRDRITEIGLILVDGAHVERFASLVNPGQPIPPFIEQMTGISDAMVADAPPFAELAESLLERLSGRLFIAHNVRFDYGVFKNEFRRAGLRFQSETLCTVKLSRRLYPQFYKHNLDAIIARHHLVLEDRHRAPADAEAVYRFLLSAGGELGENTVYEAARTLMAQSVPPEGLDRDTFDALPDVPGVYWAYDTGGLPLYVGRSANLRRGVLAHFAGGNRREVQLAGQAGRIEWRETVGEFGAELLEILQLKQLRPRLNPKGRMAGEICTIRLGTHDDGFLRPLVVDAASAAPGERYGLFRSTREARRALKDLAESVGLCQRVMGVERATSRSGHPCDGRARSHGRCHGACIGRETASEHNARLTQAMARVALKDWPFAAAIAIVEVDPVSGDRREHLFERWRYLGSRAMAGAPLEHVPLLDPDVVRLLGAYFRKPQEGTELIELG